MRPPQLPRTDDFRSPLHGARVTARLGVWLGAAFLICFVTGLISHYHQHPPPFFIIPPEPAWGFQVSQGLHVATGTACFPLLLAKVYSAYPKLFERPLVPSPLKALERASLAVLVTSSFLQIVTGVINVAQWYSVFGFGFIQVHFAFAWIAIGSLSVHIAVKLPVIRRALTKPLDAPLDADDPAAPRVSVSEAVGE